MAITCIIVDDEPRAHTILEKYIERIPELQLLGKYLDGPSALIAVQLTAPDLILLDITMPEMDGFLMLQSLAKRPFVIFTTAHGEFALESYEYNAIDYLKKPISFDRFAKAILKLQSLVKHQPIAHTLTDHIDLRVNNKLLSIPFTDILYFQSLGNYVKVFTGEKFLLAQVTTKEIEDNIPKELFLRIHKSFIINKQFISQIKDEEVLVGKSCLPIGKTYKRYVLDSLK